MHPDDAVANKVGALLSRAQARDYTDVDAVLQSGRYTSDDLLALAGSHDPGFDETVSIALRAIHRLPPAESTPYVLVIGDVFALTARMTEWVCLGGWCSRRCGRRLQTADLWRGQAWPPTCERAGSRPLARSHTPSVARTDVRRCARTRSVCAT